MKKEILIALITGIFILGGAILSSPHWFKYFFPEQYLEQEKITATETLSNVDNSKLDKEKSDKENGEIMSGTENLIISRIELSPKDFNIPSYFYFQVENKGTRTIENLDIIIDLGKAKYEKYDYSKKVEIYPITDSIDKSFLKFKVPKIKQNQSIEIYSLQTFPVFKSITMNATNMTFDKLYTYEEFQKSEEGNVTESSGFHDFLIVMLSIVIIVFTIYFGIVIITYLNKLFRIE